MSKIKYLYQNRLSAGVLRGSIALWPLSLILAAPAHAEMGKEYATPHEGWDRLWGTMLTDILIIGVVAAIITIYFLVKFKRKEPSDTGTAKPLSPLASFGWVMIPAFVFMADDVYLGLENMKHWLDFRRPPANALTVDVEAYMWGYEVKYPEGMTLQNELRVPVGKPVRVNLTSRDVIHTLFIPDLRTKWDALPGAGMFLWFHPEKPGEHVMTCTEYCGLLHADMYGKIIAMPGEEFAKWVEANKPRSETPMGFAEPPVERTEAPAGLAEPSAEPPGTPAAPTELKQGGES